MKHTAKGRSFERICAAVLLASALSPSTAREPTYELEALMDAPARIPGLRQHGTRQGMLASPLRTGSEPCPAGAPSGEDDARGAEPTFLRSLICWWQDGLARQSRALVP